MSIQNTWSIVQVECLPEANGQKNVVQALHWELVGKDENNNTGRVYGSTAIEFDENTTFTAYNNLTKEQVLQWLFDTLGNETVAAHEKNVAGQIDAALNPPVTFPELPWA